MFCVRFSVSRIMLFDFSSINIPHGKKNTQVTSLFFMSYCVACLLKLFMWLLQQLRCSRPPFPNPSQGKNRGWLSIQFLFKIKRSQDLVQMCKIYIYTYTHNYNCIYALLVPKCTLDHLSVYVCFLPELAQHLGCIGMNITISSTPWPAHLATSPYKSDGNRKKLSLSEWDSSPKKEGKK